MNRFNLDGNDDDDVNDLERRVGALKIEEDREIQAAIDRVRNLAKQYEDLIYKTQTPEVRARKLEIDAKRVAAIAARDALIAKKDRAAAAAPKSKPAVARAAPTTTVVKTEPRAVAARSREPTPLASASDRMRGFGGRSAVLPPPRELKPAGEDKLNELLLSFERESNERGVSDYVTVINDVVDAQGRRVYDLLRDRLVADDQKLELYTRLVSAISGRLKAGNDAAEGALRALSDQLQLESEFQLTRDTAAYIRSLLDAGFNERAKLTRQFRALSSGVEYVGPEIEAAKKALAYLDAQKKARADGAQQAAASSGAVADALLAARDAEQAVDDIVENNPGVPRDVGAEAGSEVADRAEADMDLVVQLVGGTVYPELTGGGKVAPETFLRGLFTNQDQGLFVWNAAKAQLTLTNVRVPTLLRFFEVLVAPLLNWWASPELADARSATPGQFGEYYWIDGVVPVVTQLILALQEKRRGREGQIQALDRAYTSVRKIAYFFVVKVATGIESVAPGAISDSTQELVKGPKGVLEQIDLVARNPTVARGLDANRLMRYSARQVEDKVGTPLTTMINVVTYQMALAAIDDGATEKLSYEDDVFVPLFERGSAVNFAALGDANSDIQSFASRMSRLFALPWFEALAGSASLADSFQDVTVEKAGVFDLLLNKTARDTLTLKAEDEPARLGTLMAELASEGAWGVDIGKRNDGGRFVGLAGRFISKDVVTENVEDALNNQLLASHEAIAVAFFTPYSLDDNSDRLLPYREDLSIFGRYGKRPSAASPTGESVALRSAARPGGSDVALVQTGASAAGFVRGVKKFFTSARRIFKLKLSKAIEEAAKDGAGIYQYASLIENTLDGRIADELDSNNEPSRTVLVPSDAALDAYFESAAYEEATRGMDADERAAYHGDVVTYHILGRRLKLDALAKSQQKLRVPTELTVYNDKTRADVLLRAEVRVLSFDAARGGSLQVNGKVVGVGPKFTAKNGDFYIIDRVVELERAKKMNLASYVPATGTRKGAAAQKKPTRAQPLKEAKEDDDIPDIFEDVEEEEDSDAPSALGTPPRLRLTGARMAKGASGKYPKMMKVADEPPFRRRYQGDDIFDDENELPNGSEEEFLFSTAEPSVKQQTSEKKPASAVPQEGRVAAIEKAARAQNEKDFAPMARLLSETGVEDEVRAARAKGEHFYVLAPKGEALRSAGLDVDALDAKTIAGSEELREFARAHVVRADWSNQVSKARHHRAMMPQDMVYLLQQREGTAMKTLAKTGARAIQHVPIDVREAATAPEHEHAQLHIKDIELYRAPHRLGDDKELFVYFTKRPLIAPPTTTKPVATATKLAPTATKLPPKVDAESKAPTAAAAAGSSERWHSTVKAVEQKLQKSSDVDAYHEHVETLQSTIDSLGGAQALLEHVDQVQVDSSFAKLRQAIARNPHMDTSRKMDAHTALEQAHNRFPALTTTNTTN